MMRLLVGLASLLSACTIVQGKITTLVTFGDSYTDQSRLSYFNQNGSAPPPHYQEVYPPAVDAANGGASWVRYAEVYGGIKTQNYAVSGAACSNKQTGRPGNGPDSYPHKEFPDVQEYEIPAFLKDHLVSGAKGVKALDLDPATTVYSIWIGTNDVGFGALLTGNQSANGATIVNVTQCALDWADQLYSYGARQFVFMNMIPLELVPLYSAHQNPLDRYWPYARNRTQWSIQMRELVNSGNALWDLQVPSLAATSPGSSTAVFNSNQLFRDMYYNPTKYLNGTAPANVTGWCAHSNITGGDTHVCKSPDSFLWYDSLHPSEQADRWVAREMVTTLERKSSYAKWWGMP